MSKPTERGHPAGVQLVVGASGLVGAHVARALRDAGHHVVATFQKHPIPEGFRLDIRREPDVVDVVNRVRPTVVYVPAAFTHVDGCEQNPAESCAVNVDGLGHVLRACRPFASRVVYFSTDYVFDGAGGPYGEEDAVNPRNVYGRHKLAGEGMVAAAGPEHLIVRTTGVYGWEAQGNNFVVRLRRSLQSGTRVRAPRDQMSTPTYAVDLARAVVQLVGSGAGGLFHVVGSQRTDRYRFALAAARAFGLDETLVESVSTPELGQAAPRPLGAGLRGDRAARALGWWPRGFEDGLAAMARDEGSFP